MSSFRAYCFTLNNYTEEQYAAFKQKVPSLAKYCIVGEEKGEEKETPHLQGYVQLHKQTKFNTIKAWWTNEIHGEPHIERAKASPIKNKVYCGKEGNYWEHGEIPAQGKRNDVAAFMKAVEEGKPDTHLIRNYPGEFARYYKAAERARKAFKEEKVKVAMKMVYAKKELKEWQKDVVEKLQNQTDRQVTWVYDPVGNQGKTFLAMWLQADRECYYCDGGKKADIAYGYQDQPTVIFDFVRTGQDYVPYGCIESFKNGIIFSPKYESGSRIFGVCKVLVLSNFYPKKEALSEDRWDIVDLTPKINNEKKQNKARVEVRVCSHNNCNEINCLCQCHYDDEFKFN